MIYPKIFNNFSYILNKKTSKSIIIWILFLIIGSLIFLIIAFNYKFNLYENYNGYIKKNDDSYYTIIYLEESKINEVLKYDLLVDKVKYEYEILDISEDYYLVLEKPYYQVTLKIDLNDKLLIDNNIINIVFEKPKTTIFQEIKKGLEIWKK